MIDTKYANFTIDDCVYQETIFISVYTSLFIKVQDAIPTNMYTSLFNWIEYRSFDKCWWRYRWSIQNL